MILYKSCRNCGRIPFLDELYDSGNRKEWNSQMRTFCWRCKHFEGHPKGVKYGTTYWTDKRFEK